MHRNLTMGLLLLVSFALGRYTQWEATSDERLERYVQYTAAREQLITMEPQLRRCEEMKAYYKDSLHAANKNLVGGDGFTRSLEKSKYTGRGGPEVDW